MELMKGQALESQGCGWGLWADSLEMEARLLGAVGSRVGPWVNHMPLGPMTSAFDPGYPAYWL